MHVPPCAFCGHGSELIMHVLFFCQFARLVWLASPLGLHADGLFKQVLTLLSSFPLVSSFKLFLETMWALWKVCCPHIYDEKPILAATVIGLAITYM